MQITTAEQLLRATEVGRCELVRGEFRELIPPSFEHGRVAMRIGARIVNYVEAHGLGTVVAAETGFLLSRDPDTVRAPDVAFVRASRRAGAKRGYYPGAPDLAVEVLSPDDRPGYVREKIAEWLDAGTIAVWVVDPREQTVAVHAVGHPSRKFDERDIIRGGSLLPGFEVAVRDIFGA